MPLSLVAVAVVPIKVVAVAVEVSYLARNQSLLVQFWTSLLEPVGRVDPVPKASLRMERTLSLVQSPRLVVVLEPAEPGQMPQDQVDLVVVVRERPPWQAHPEFRAKETLEEVDQRRVVAVAVPIKSDQMEQAPVAVKVEMALP